MSARSKRSARIELELSNRALIDLAEILEYSTSQFGPTTANKYLDEIESALDRLVENPSLLRLEPGLSSSLFLYRVRQHFLVCDLQSQNLLVLAVIHTSMDLPARLHELEPRLSVETESLQKILRKRSE